MPRETALTIVAIEAVSSCGPQPYAQPLPPRAHAPRPMLVISSSVVPRRFLWGCIASAANIDISLPLPPPLRWALLHEARPQDSPRVRGHAAFTPSTRRGVWNFLARLRGLRQRGARGRLPQ